MYLAVRMFGRGQYGETSSYTVLDEKTIPQNENLPK